MYTPLVESHYKEVLRQLEQENKIKMEGKGPRGGIYYTTKIFIPHKNPHNLFILPKQVSKLKIHYKEYLQAKGKRKILVDRVNDGSIIKGFDKTPLPKEPNDIVCPHFLELKWAYGCPYDCAWCYLKGTFRFRPEGKKPVIKDYEKIELHTKAFLEKCKTPEILNTGEIADSLMGENRELPFSKFIIPLFESQKIHKVLFLTKSANIKNLLELKSHNQVIMSFSLNAIPVAKRWEKAPDIMKRLEAAEELYKRGFEVRVRIDPMVPIDDWEKQYLYLIDLVFERFIPERITLGSLRGLQSTINGCTDKSWVKYLSEGSNWGRKIDKKVRHQMYRKVISYLRRNYNYKKIALCKETIEMWQILGMNFKQIKCNCIW
jgi:spore photoproduct lyase